MAYRGSKLVSPEPKTTAKLNYGGNFDTWRTKIDSMLVNNAVNYVLTKPKPSKQSDLVGHNKWIRDNFTARRILLESLHEQIFADFSEIETAKDLMEKLKAQFTKPSLSKRMDLLRRYMGAKMQGKTLISEHITEMGAMAADLEKSGMKVPESMQAAALLNSLPENWSDVRNYVAASVEVDPKDERGGLLSVIRILQKQGAMKQSVRCHANYDSDDEDYDGPFFPGICDNCGSYGHQEAHCPWSKSVVFNRTVRIC